MNEFVQMDIFFFITTVVALVFLVLITIVGTYIFLLVRKIHKIINEVKEIIQLLRTQGGESLGVIKEKIDSILNNVGWVEKSIIAALGTIIAKTFVKRGKISKEVQKRK